MEIWKSKMVIIGKLAKPNLLTLAWWTYLCQDGCLDISIRKLCPLLRIYWQSYNNFSSCILFTIEEVGVLANYSFILHRSTGLFIARSSTIHRPQWIRVWLSYWNLCLIDCLLVCGQILSFISSSSSVLLCYGILKNSLLWITNNRC